MDSHARRSPIRREISRQRQDRGFGCGISRRLEETLAAVGANVERLIRRNYAVGRGYVYDAPALPARHFRPEDLARAKCARQVDVERTLPTLKRVLLEPRPFQAPSFSHLAAHPALL